MNRVTAWIAAAVAVVATALFVTAVSASAAQANATVRDDGTTYVYDGEGVDQVLIGTNGTNTGVTFNASILADRRSMRARRAPRRPSGRRAPQSSRWWRTSARWTTSVSSGPRRPRRRSTPGPATTGSSVRPSRSPGSARAATTRSSAAPARTHSTADGDDVLRGGSGGADDVHGGPGNDTYEHPWRDSVTFTLDDLADDGPLGIANVHSDVENVVTGAGDDRLVGSDRANVLSSGDGQDTLDGGAGRDRLLAAPATTRSRRTTRSPTASTAATAPTSRTSTRST